MRNSVFGDETLGKARHSMKTLPKFGQNPQTIHSNWVRNVRFLFTFSSTTLDEHLLSVEFFFASSFNRHRPKKNKTKTCCPLFLIPLHPSYSYSFSSSSSSFLTFHVNLLSVDFAFILLLFTYSVSFLLLFGHIFSFKIACFSFWLFVFPFIIIIIFFQTGKVRNGLEPPDSTESNEKIRLKKKEIKKTHEIKNICNQNPLRSSKIHTGKPRKSVKTQ